LLRKEELREYINRLFTSTDWSKEEKKNGNCNY